MMSEKRTLREEHVGPVDMFFVYLDTGPLACVYKLIDSWLFS